MTLPPINPNKSTSGIAVDPRTLERVIPESKRSDGTVRKERKVRPGFTPQEDVSRFRGTKQQQLDRNALPKGHIPGWVAPSSETKAKAATGAGSGDKPLSKSAAKNAKRKAKKIAEKDVVVKENWDDDDDDDEPANGAGTAKAASTTQVSQTTANKSASADEANKLAAELQTLKVG